MVMARERSVLDLDRCLEELYAGHLLAPTVVSAICRRTKEVLLAEPNVARVATPVTVVGDVHGQFYDVLEIFCIGGRPPDTNYLFLGDYVDRGYYSVETVTLLVCLKLRYPQRVTLLRGNHESRLISGSYGFYAECCQKYPDMPTVWNDFTSLFDFLTLGAVIDDTLFCVHGGLSPTVLTLDEISAINRFEEVPSEGPMCDLLWADPLDSPGAPRGFGPSTRGAGFTYGRDAVDRFLHVNNFETLIRAHQLCMEGHQLLFDGKVITVWSAPNYCYRCGNLASILEITSLGERRFNSFDAAPSKVRQIPECVKEAQMIHSPPQDSIHAFGGSSSNSPTNLGDIYDEFLLPGSDPFAKKDSLPPPPIPDYFL